MISINAFMDCSSLRSIKLPNKLEIISSEAFKRCASLKEVHIPNSVVSMGYSVFTSCPLLNITCETPRQPDEWNPMWNPDNCTVSWNCKNN